MRRGIRKREKVRLCVATRQARAALSDAPGVTVDTPPWEYSNYYYYTRYSYSYNIINQ